MGTPPDGTGDPLPAEVASLLVEREQALEVLISELRAHLRDREGKVERIHLIEYEYRLELAEAEARFVRRLREFVEAGEVGSLWRGLHTP